MRLYVNIDHVATIREARKTDEPDPVQAASAAERARARCSRYRNPYWTLRAFVASRRCSAERITTRRYTREADWPRRPCGAWAHVPKRQAGRRDSRNRGTEHRAFDRQQRGLLGAR